MAVRKLMSLISQLRKQCSQNSNLVLFTLSNVKGRPLILLPEKDPSSYCSFPLLPCVSTQGIYISTSPSPVTSSGEIISIEL